MMNVKTSIIFICISLIFLSCKMKNEVFKNSSNKFVYIDIIGDSKVDTLKVKSNKGNTEVSFVNKGKTQKIITLYPLLSEKFKTTIPPIEIVYIEANYIQTDKKSFRVKIRNTDLHPDYYYIDISLNNNEIYITNLGLINSTDSVFIKGKEVMYKLKNVLDKNNGINISNFIKNECL